MNVTSTPNAFQKSCQERLGQHLSSAGIEAQFDWTEGDGSYLSAYLRACFGHGGQELELFIDEDQVGFTFAGRWHSYEKCDYPTVGDLLDKVTASLTDCLKADPVKYSRDREIADQLGKLRFAAMVFLVVVVVFVASLIVFQEGLVRAWVSGTVAVVGFVLLVWTFYAAVRVVSLRRRRFGDHASRFQ